jgi:hypothetical protein
MPRTVLSTTLCERKRNLKERLIHIMSIKKKSRFWLILSIALIALSLLAACALGAAAPVETAPELQAEAPADSAATDTDGYAIIIQTGSLSFSPEICERAFEMMKSGIGGVANASDTYFCVDYTQERGIITTWVIAESDGTSMHVTGEGANLISDKTYGQIDMWLTATLNDGSERTEQLEILDQKGNGRFQYGINLGRFGGVDNIQSASLRVVFSAAADEQEDIVKEVPNAWELFHRNWYDRWQADWGWLVPKVAVLTPKQDAAIRALIQERLPAMLGVDGHTLELFQRDYLLCGPEAAPDGLGAPELVQQLGDADRVALYRYRLVTTDGAAGGVIYEGYVVLGLFGREWKFIQMPDGRDYLEG